VACSAYSTRGIGLHPAPDATGIDLNTTFRQELGNVFVGERISQVPSDAQNNHLARERRPLNGLAAVIGIDSYPTKPIAAIRNGTVKHNILIAL
jgi:hypothetical protein